MKASLALFGSLICDAMLFFFFIFYFVSLLPFLLCSVQIPRQLNPLALYRCEQPVLDHCHAHLSLHHNVGMEPSARAPGGPGPAPYHPGLMAALPSELALPRPRTRSQCR